MRMFILIIFMAAGAGFIYLALKELEDRKR